MYVNIIIILVIYVIIAVVGILNAFSQVCMNIYNISTDTLILIIMKM